MLDVMHDRAATIPLVLVFADLAFVAVKPAHHPADCFPCGADVKPMFFSGFNPVFQLVKLLLCYHLVKSYQTPSCKNLTC